MNATVLQGEGIKSILLKNSGPLGSYAWWRHVSSTSESDGIRSECLIRACLSGDFDLNRVAELARLLDSLVAQEFKDFEVVFVDQNCDDRIVPVLARYQDVLEIKRVATPTRRGISAGRNDGWHQACGEIVVFPDDDCWYPRWFLRKGVELLDSTGSELVTGRIADETGRSINGRFSSRASTLVAARCG